ncbi:hypothetical protein D1122_04585 [Cereibacter sphaeroides]|uniref:hypothetical protein n=1 Tax=Cereibacter sphaeroides TaxID=1063 RepID=UPI000E5A3FE7|nr:hypothetical protein [Cereibacter sphaeroides]RIA00030.1 hypothetical protein D1122_04585 [Cereibacter sphaeroides]
MQTITRPQAAARGLPSSSANTRGPSKAELLVRYSDEVALLLLTLQMVAQTRSASWRSQYINSFARYLRSEHLRSSQQSAERVEREIQQ